MTEHEVYLIWSNEHRAWWGPGGRGYGTGLDGAGHYSRDKALAICRTAIPQAAHVGGIAEIPVRLADVQAFLDGQERIPDVIMEAS